MGSTFPTRESLFVEFHSGLLCGHAKVLIVYVLFGIDQIIQTLKET